MYSSENPKIYGDYTKLTTYHYHHFTTCVNRHLEVRSGGYCWSKFFTASKSLLMATNTFQLGRRHYSSLTGCYLHCLCTIMILS